MFEEETVFILGAGASSHYGYPTGEQLVNEVKETTKHLQRLFEESKHHTNAQFPEYVTAKNNVLLPVFSWQPEKLWDSSISELDQLGKRLEQVNPIVIDTFLGHNKKLQDIGKLVIALVLLKRNRAGRLVQNDWYRFIIHKIITKCKQSKDILENKVTFVTFNYDTS